MPSTIQPHWSPCCPWCWNTKLVPTSGLVTSYFFSLGCSDICQVVLVLKNPPANAGDVEDMSSIPGSGRSPGEGNGNPLQYSCLERRLAAYSSWGHKESDTTEETSHACTFLSLVGSLNVTVRFLPQPLSKVTFQALSHYPTLIVCLALSII